MFYFSTPQLAIDRHDVARQKHLLTQTYAGEGWEVPRLIEAMGSAQNFYFDRVAMARMDRWANGRVALLGDAAYCPSPLSGMGTSLALVGAYVLAGELATAGDDYTGAFTSSQRQMSEAVARAQKFARSAHHFLLPTSRAFLRINSLAMRVMPYLPKGRVSSGVEKAANAVTLKDYAGVTSAAAMSL